MPCLGQRTKCMPSSFKSIYQLQIYILIIAFVLGVQTNFIQQIKLIMSGLRQDSHEFIYPVKDKLAQNYVPCLGQIGQKPYPFQRQIPISAIKESTHPVGRKHCLKLGEKLSRVLKVKNQSSKQILSHLKIIIIMANRDDKSQPIYNCIFTSISTLILGLMVQIASISP